MRTTDRLVLCSRLAGAVWGHLVGDAVGVPYEFKSAAQVTTVEFGAQGTHGQPPGTWSDDGALMLALLDSLTRDGASGFLRPDHRFDLADQASRILAWREQGAYAPGGIVFDIGVTTQRALHELAKGTPPEDAGPIDDGACGNGSLMRILPLALAERNTPDATLVEHARLASRVTHGHPRCQVACALYALIVRRLLRGAEPADALAKAQRVLRAALAHQPDHLAALAELERFERRAGSGFVFDAFWSAWDAFAGAAAYADAIERAVRFGNDTDTTAAIAGGLAGIRFGWEGIPVDWRTRMRGREIVRPILDRLLADAGAATSTRKPQRIERVPLGGLPDHALGRLGITVLPGQKRDGWRGLRWRDLDADIAALRDAGVDTFALLMEDHEIADWCRVPEAVPALAAAGRPKLVRFPIQDPRIPTDHAAYRALVTDLATRVAAGEFVAVACRGGLDRSGMTAACILVALGLRPKDAIARVRRSRRGALTYREQVDYVEGFAG